MFKKIMISIVIASFICMSTGIAFANPLNGMVKDDIQNGFIFGKPGEELIKDNDEYHKEVFWNMIDQYEGPIAPVLATNYLDLIRKVKNQGNGIMLVTHVELYKLVNGIIQRDLNSRPEHSDIADKERNAIRMIRNYCQDGLNTYAKNISDLMEASSQDVREAFSKDVEKATAEIKNSARYQNLSTEIK